MKTYYDLSHEERLVIHNMAHNRESIKRTFLTAMDERKERCILLTSHAPYQECATYFWDDGDIAVYVNDVLQLTCNQFKIVKHCLSLGLDFTRL